MPDYKAEEALIALAEKATTSSQKQTFNGAQNQVKTINDIILQQAAMENLKLSEAFRYNALFKAGVPLPPFDDVELPETTTTITNNISPQPEAPPAGPSSLVKNLVLGSVLGASGLASGLGLGSLLKEPPPTIITAPAETKDGSLLQYLEDESFNVSPKLKGE